MRVSSWNSDLFLTLQIMHDSQTQTIMVPWEGQNAQQVLEGTYNQIRDHGTFSFGVKFFGTYQNDQQGGPLGYFVNMVNGIYDLPAEHVYWELLIDGKPASKGIDSTYPAAGATVTLRQTPYSEVTHRNTALEKKHRAYVARTRSIR